MKKTFFKNLAFILVLTTSALVAGYFVLFSVIKQKNVTVADASLDLEVKAKQAVATDSIRKVIVESEKEIAAIEGYFVSAEGVVDFIEYLEGIAKDLGVEIVIQDVQEKDSEFFPQKGELHFKVAVQGSWGGVYRFLTALEDMPYGVRLGYADVKKNTSGQMLRGSDTLPVSGASTQIKVAAWQGDFEFTVLKHK